MTTYMTSDIARKTGLHPNTIRFYEEIGFITKPARKPNGYRVFTPLHLEQVRFCRLALRAEVMQNGLRDTAVDIIRLCAACNFSKAHMRAQGYISQIEREIDFAKSAIRSVETILSSETLPDAPPKKRSEAAQALDITQETLRNWERNGLVAIHRLQNGYRMYTNRDMERLLIIRTLRCANYSLSAILRLTGALAHSRAVPILDALNTPQEGDEIVSVCDHLLTALACAREDAQEMLSRIEQMKNIATLH